MKTQAWGVEVPDHEASVPTYVRTPGGSRATDQVLVLTPDEDIVIENGVIGAINRRTKKRRFLPPPSHDLVAFFPNWIAFATWDTGGGEIDSMTVSFTVPTAPADDSGQIIFLFGGLQDANRTQIVQPVLQWCGSTEDGVAGWSIGGWFANSNGQSAVTRLTPVQPGAQLTGFVRYRGRDDTGYIYDVGFGGAAETNRTLNGITALLTEAAIALESYGAGGDADYPQSATTRFSHIALGGQGGHLDPAWISPPAAGNQRCAIIDASTIDISYR